MSQHRPKQERVVTSDGVKVERSPRRARTVRIESFNRAGYRFVDTSTMLPERRAEVMQLYVKYMSELPKALHCTKIECATSQVENITFGMFQNKELVAFWQFFNIEILSQDDERIRVRSFFIPGIMNIGDSAWDTESQRVIEALKDFRMTTLAGKGFIVPQWRYSDRVSPVLSGDFNSQRVLLDLADPEVAPERPRRRP